MFLQNIIEVIVGLVFTWFVLSTATVQIQEWIAARLHWRANDLEDAIRRMLNDHGLTKLFYDHPIIKGLSVQENDPRSKPSYIPARQFSTVLLSIILAASTESAALIHGLYGLSEQLKLIKSEKRRRQAQADLDRIFELARLSGNTESGSAIDNLILATLEKEIDDLGQRFEELRDAIQLIRDKANAEREQIERLSKSLTNLEAKSGNLKTLLSGALALGVINPGLKLAMNSLLIGIDKPGLKDEEFLELLQSNIETWFNDSMDRLSGWYKRKVQLMTFVIGLAIALILNVDTIHLSNQLWREPTLREAIGAKAALILEQYSPEDEAGSNDALSALQLLQEQYLGLPIGWNIRVVELRAEQTCSFVPGAGEVFGATWHGECHQPSGAVDSTNGWGWLIAKIAGLLMTGLASAQGSSFWFDVLMKVVNVRSAGIKPA
jgi:hypothetical protein